MLRRLSSGWRSVSTFLDVLGVAGARFATSPHPLDNARGLVQYTLEFLRHFSLELAFHQVDVRQLGERPSTERLQVVHSGHPVRLHRQLFVLRVLAPVSL